MMHVRDQVSDAVVATLRALPAYEGRVYREAALGWDERIYPAAVIVSGATGVRRLSDNDGYQIESRAIRFSVAIGVREFEGEDPMAALSGVLTATEDAVIALQEEPWCEEMVVTEISGATQTEDADGSIAATVVEIVARAYTMAGRSGEFVAFQGSTYHLA